jgi:hypothetical protein
MGVLERWMCEEVGEATIGFSDVGAHTCVRKVSL